MNDLSHVFANEADEGQDHHGNLPKEAMHHLARAFAHQAGLGPHPGLYKGPNIISPEDWSTPSDTEGQQESAQDEALQNISMHQNPINPTPAKPASALKLPGF